MRWRESLSTKADDEFNDLVVVLTWVFVGFFRIIGVFVFILSSFVVQDSSSIAVL